MKLNSEKAILWAGGGTAGVVSFLYGEWTTALSALGTLIVLDYVTGVIAAFVKGKIDSTIGLRGFFKKVCVIAVPAVVHLLCMSVGQADLGGLSASVVAGALAFNEAISVLENLSRAGVTMPSFILKRLKKLREALLSDDDQPQLHIG